MSVRKEELDKRLKAAKMAKKWKRYSKPGKVNQEVAKD